MRSARRLAKWGGVVLAWALLPLGCDKSEWGAGSDPHAKEWDGPPGEKVMGPGQGVSEPGDAPPPPPPVATAAPNAEGAAATPGSGTPAPGGPGEAAPPAPPTSTGVAGSGAPGFEGGVPLGSPPLPEGTKGVKVKGTIVFPGYSAGIIQIDVMDSPARGPTAGSHPQILRLHRVEKPGPFEIDVAAGQGAIYLTAYNDVNMDGAPSRDEPSGSYKDNPVTVGQVDVSGVTIELKKELIPPPPGQRF